MAILAMTITSLLTSTAGQQIRVEKAGGAVIEYYSVGEQVLVHVGGGVAVAIIVAMAGTKVILDIRKGKRKKRERLPKQRMTKMKQE